VDKRETKISPSSPSDCTSWIHKTQHFIFVGLPFCEDLSQRDFFHA